MLDAASNSVNCRLSRTPWNLNGFQIAGEFRPAESLAGDFYALTARTPKRLSVVIGDACGRGCAGAKMLTAVLPKLAELFHRGARPGRLLDELNAFAAQVLPIDRFVTATALELDAEHHLLTVANAGHVPALMRTRGGDVRRVGRASGPPLGVAANACYFEETALLQRGDIVVLMTDGVLEAVETDLCTMSAFQRLLLRAPQGADAVEDWLLEAFDRSPSSMRLDDATLLVIEVTEACQAIAPWVEQAS